MSFEPFAKSDVLKKGPRYPLAVPEIGCSNVPAKGRSASQISDSSPNGNRLKNQGLRQGSAPSETNPEQLNLSGTLIRKLSSSSEEERRDSPSAPRVSKNLPEAREKSEGGPEELLPSPVCLETERRPGRGSDAWAGVNAHRISQSQSHSAGAASKPMDSP